MSAETSNDSAVVAPGEVYLSPQQVSRRYSGSPSIKTLSRWRSQKSGPAYRKIGGRIRYPLSKLIAWERRLGFACAGELET